MALELTDEEAVIVKKVMQAVKSLPCCLDEFAGLTAEEAGWEDDEGIEPDECPLWSLEKKMRNV